MVRKKQDRQAYYRRLRDGYRPIGDYERAVAQAIADGANSLNDIARVSGLKRDVAYRALLNLRGHGIVLPPNTDMPQRFQGGLTIAPGYVVHKREIFQLMKVGTK